MKKVKFLVSIAGFADPDCEQLDKKYEQFTARAKQASEKKGRELKPGPVKLVAAQPRSLTSWQHPPRVRPGQVPRSFAHASPRSSR